MEQIVSYRLEEAVATIMMEDSNKNVLSPRMLRELNGALDRATEDRAVVVLTGREDVFCAGFDLNILRRGVLDAFVGVRDRCQSREGASRGESDHVQAQPGEVQRARRAA